MTVSRDAHPSPEAWLHWKGRVNEYVESQGEPVQAVRNAMAMPDPPYPDVNNPMLGYLIETTSDVLEKDPSPEGIQSALTWLAVHAWYEGALFQIAGGLAPR